MVKQAGTHLMMKSMCRAAYKFSIFLHRALSVLSSLQLYIAVLLDMW